MIRNVQEKTLPWGKSLKTTYQLKGDKFLRLKAHSGSWHSLSLGCCLESMSLQKERDLRRSHNAQTNLYQLSEN